jgi:hypothetical protein
MKRERKAMLIVLGCAVAAWAMFAKYQQQAEFEANRLPSVTYLEVPGIGLVKVAPRFVPVLDDIRAGLTDTAAVKVWMQAGALKPVERRR